MSISSWIDSLRCIAYGSAHADDLEKSASSILESVKQLKQDVGRDADAFCKEKEKIERFSKQLNGYREQAETIEKSSQDRLGVLKQHEEAYTSHIEKIGQVASLALVPDSVTVLKKELDGSMKELVAAAKMLAKAFEALKEQEKEAITKREKI